MPQLEWDSNLSAFRLRRAERIPMAGDQHDETSMTRVNTALVHDDMPEDIEEFRRELIRRMNNMLREWRSCDQPICRRARKCVAKNLACSAKPSTMTPQQAARAKFMLKRALEKRLAECRDEDNGEIKLPAEKRRKKRQDARGLTTRRTCGRGRK